MATLNWIGKEAVVNHHREVPYRLLKADPSLSVGEDGGLASGNLLVQGDNLEALKALLPYYGGKVKCIYIDPPYNTGNEGWVYNDNVNSPQIRAWLEGTLESRKVDADDLSRHDKWLCMMYPRLALLKEFLREDGFIFVSIDDSEFASLRLLLSEVFGADNFIGVVVWHRKRGSDNSAKNLSRVHEYLVCYAKDASRGRLERVEMPADTKKAYRNPDNDPRGPYRLLGTWSRGTQGGSRFAFRTKKGQHFAERLWLFNSTSLSNLDAEDKLVSVGDKLYRKLFLSEHTGTIPQSIWDDASNAANAADELKHLFGAQVFETPKPTPFIQRVVEIAAGADGLVLDSFAGSGTAAHAVLAMNKADGGNRKFICIEMDEMICKTITRERIARVIEGYHPGGDRKKGRVEGLGGGFRYVTLGPTLFDEYGRFRSGEDKVTFGQLAAHIFFTQTGEPLPKQVNGKRSPLIGTFRGTAYYLLYNGILGDRSVAGGNVLTRETLAMLPKHTLADGSPGPRVVFGEACRLSDATLRREGIEFRQIPYQVEVG